MDLTSLPALTVLSDNVTIVEKDKVKIVRVIHDKATAGIALHGGHVVSFKPTGKEDLIWMSNSAIFDGEAALRGGIPVCWPWFGRIASPSHGFARNSEWTLIQHRENEHGVIIELGLQSNEETLAIWPNQFEVRLIVEVTEQLKVTLQTTNTDAKPWTFSGALHSYLNVGDIAKANVIGMGPSYIDSLLEDKECQGGESLAIDQSVDRIYTQPEAVITLQDKALDRSVNVENHGHNCAVIWNPWKENAQSMSDMDNDGYKTMLCIESTVLADSIEEGITLQPSESHQLVTVISA
ncbi:D-hexose-6-phosphate mutarotase [Vibrio sonorensis]|uniref:D-hexose-6-phosphate mutarotase n=1 Tax=Vibrio sonorensis TaxID=1004316 RepID=UPI0008DABBEA|nr:D-hexose-6-phosphate mutarotase [Vibrio sonorensis]